jgi:hypothetical protein
MFIGAEDAATRVKWLLAPEISSTDWAQACEYRMGPCLRGHGRSPGAACAERLDAQASHGLTRRACRDRAVGVDLIPAQADEFGGA